MRPSFTPMLCLKIPVWVVAKFYTIEVDGTQMEVLAVLGSDGNG